MKMLGQKAGWMCAGITALLIGAVQGDHWYNSNGLIKMSGELRQHAQELGSEFRSHYRSTPQFGNLQSQARDIVVHATRLQSLARSGASASELRRDVVTLSHNYRLLHKTVRAAESSYGAGYPGPAWRYGNNPVRNEHVGHLLTCVDTLLRQIDGEVTKLAIAENNRNPHHDHSDHDHDHSGPIVGRPVTHGNSAISIGNGRLTFQFGR